jgi:hypothetical protein
MEEIRIFIENHRPAASHWQTLSHNYHTITTMAAPQHFDEDFSFLLFLLTMCFYITLKLWNNKTPVNIFTKTSLLKKKWHKINVYIFFFLSFLCVCVCACVWICSFTFVYLLPAWFLKILFFIYLILSFYLFLECFDFFLT